MRSTGGRRLAVPDDVRAFAPTVVTPSAEEDQVSRSKIAKKVEKLEKDANKLRKKAEKKGKELQSQASGRIDELNSEIAGGKKKKSKSGLIAAILAFGGAIAAFGMKKKRDQELDEALWEEPRSI